MKNTSQLSKICGVAFIIAFILLCAVLIFGAARFPHNANTEAISAVALKNFKYEISIGDSEILGEATFPHYFSNLAPRTAVTIYADITPGQYENLLVKTVYTGLRLYADDTLIYECGQLGSYPAWLLDPPTLLKIVPLPESASQLRFEYISPSQRTTMSVPEVIAGNDGALFARLFSRNAVILTVSVFLLLLGMAVVFISVLFRRDGAVFLHLGLFALAVGCWSFGESNATAFIISYPVLLYLMAFIGLFTLTIPLLRYGLLIIRPKNPLPMKIALIITATAAIVALALQFAGLVSLSKSVYFFHFLIPSELVVFAVTTAREWLKNKNQTAKQFALPTLVLAVAAILEIINYSLRFTNILSLFFLAGALLYTIMLGVIGIRYAAQAHRAFEEAETKNIFYHRMSHDMLTPLARVSSNVQMAEFMPETAGERLREAQADVMLIAEMVNKALSESKGGDE